MKQFFNLLNGKISTKGLTFKTLSPLNQEMLGKGYILSADDVNVVFEKSLFSKSKPTNLKDLENLGKCIKQNRNKFIEQIVLETGYILKDSEDIVDGAIEFVTYFHKHLSETTIKLPEATFSYAHKIPRKLKIISLPYGVVSAMTSQNAPLILELTVLLNALAVGNNVVLRPSSQCVGTASLLIEALSETFPEEILQRVSIVSCKATDFLNASYNKANLIHYIGSSGHGKNILNDSLKYNVKALVDGEGTSTVVIDETAPIKEVVQECANGIIRCNGELCSSIRTIVVHHKKSEEFIKLLVDKIKQIEPGDPRSKTTDIGPLFHAKQAEDLRTVVKKYSLLSGDLTPNFLGANYLTPLLCKLDSKDTSFLHEQIFGPITGIVSYKGEEWKKWLTDTPYKLNDAVFSSNKNFIDEFIATSAAPRVVINHDPSIESVFEPWGAFLPSGQNDVSFWINKYRKFIQIDETL